MFDAGFVPSQIQRKVLNLVYEMYDKYAQAHPEKKRKFTDTDAQKIVEDWEMDYVFCFDDVFLGCLRLAWVTKPLLNSFTKL
jgi:hypothetical protein